MDGEITQSKLLLMCFQLVLKSGIRAETTPEEWLKNLLYLHSKGWLFVGFEDDKLAVVAAAYRIKEVKEDQLNVLPEVSEGKILYVPFVVSFAKDMMLPARLLKQFLNQLENKDIEEIIVEDRKDDHLIRRKLVKGEKDGQRKEAGASSDTLVSAGPELPAGNPANAGAGQSAN